jgi:hypothetical protein
MLGELRSAGARAPRRNRSTRPRTQSNAGATTSIATMRPSRRPWASSASAILPRLSSSANSQNRRERPWGRPPNDCTRGYGLRCPGVVDSTPFQGPCDVVAPVVVRRAGWGSGGVDPAESAAGFGESPVLAGAAVPDPMHADQFFADADLDSAPARPPRARWWPARPGRAGTARRAGPSRCPGEAAGGCSARPTRRAVLAHPRPSRRSSR